MKQSISLPIESFALVKSGRGQNSRDWGRDEPRWVQQVRNIRIELEEKTRSLLSAMLVVEHDARFDYYDMWQAGYDPAMTNLFKSQNEKVFYLDHERWVDDRGNLHNDNAPALKSGQHEFYFLHGLHIEDPKFITTPIEQIDAGRILEIRNADLRRELIRRKGLEMFLGQLFHRVIDKRGDYELLQVVIGERTSEFGTYLKMLNPSIGVWHMEGVPNDIRTVDAALLWRNNGWFVDADRIT